MSEPITLREEVLIAMHDAGREAGSISVACLVNMRRIQENREGEAPVGALDVERALQKMAFSKEVICTQKRHGITIWKLLAP